SGTGVLEEHDRGRVLLHEYIKIAVTVDVHELRTRHIESAEERQFIGAAVLIVDDQGADLALELCSRQWCALHLPWRGDGGGTRRDDDCRTERDEPLSDAHAFPCR